MSSSIRDRWQKTPSSFPSLISSPSLSSSTLFFPRDLIWETDFRENCLILVKNVMLLTSVMNRPAEKSKLTAAPHSSLPDFVSREAWDCFFSVFPLVSKGESNLIFCRDFHNLAGFCSRDLAIPFIIQKTLPHPFLSQNSFCEITYCSLCKVNMKCCLPLQTPSSHAACMDTLSGTEFILFQFSEACFLEFHSICEAQCITMSVFALGLVLCRDKICKKYRFMKNQKSCMSLFTHGRCQTRGARQQKLLSLKSL